VSKYARGADCQSNFICSVHKRVAKIFEVALIVRIDLFLLFLSHTYSVQGL
jgi:hypothetical protein